MHFESSRQFKQLIVDLLDPLKAVYKTVYITAKLKPSEG